MSLYYLEESEFLQRFPAPLQKHLKPLLAQKSMRTHKQLGNEATTFLELLVKEEMALTFGDEVFDKYGRILAYVWDRDTTLNDMLIEEEHAVPYFVYPNAVNPTESIHRNVLSPAIHYRDHCLTLVVQILCDKSCQGEETV